MRMTINQYAEHQQVSRPTIYKWIKEGQLKAFRVAGKTIRIRYSDIDTMVNESMLNPGEGVTPEDEQTEEVISEDTKAVTLEGEQSEGTTHEDMEVITHENEREEQDSTRQII